MKMKRFIQLLFFFGFLIGANVSAQEASLQTNLLESRGIMSFRPMDMMVKPATLSKVWVDKPIPLSFYTPQEIEGQIYINQKVADGIITYSPLGGEKDWTEIDFEDITPYTWKWVDFELLQRDSSLTKAHLLRPHWWLQEVGADSVGKKVYLNMPELGSQGWSTVKAIRINQLDTRFWDEQRKGDYVSRPITGKFEHESNDVYHLYYANNSKPLGVTGSHPIWSMDRNGWVGAGELKIGEKVKTKEGETTLTSRQKIQGKQTVYNLEIYRDHNFHVSKDAILVHNSCIYDVWNIGDHVVDVAHHNWNKIFGNVKPTLADVKPYIDDVLQNSQWQSVKVYFGKGGVVEGEGLIARRTVNGQSIWVEGFKDKNGLIYVKNAGVD